MPEAEDFLAERHPAVLAVASWTRAVVLAADGDLVERVYRGWDGIGFRHPVAGYVCGLFPREHDVRLSFEHGRRLADPDGLLEGDGSQTRFVTVRAPADELAAALTRLVHEAVAERLVG